MSSLATNPTPQAVATASADTHRVHSVATDPTVLADIYKDEVTIAVWQRSLNPTLQAAVDTLVAEKPWFKVAITLAPESAKAALTEATNRGIPDLLAEDIAKLVDMFCCLFDLERAGLRLTTVGSAMCPRFHVDHNPCRLITTFHGPATEWLPHHRVDRSKLGPGSNGQPDAESGLYQREDDIQRVNCGDVILIKGGMWQGNEHAGLVHRSPAVPTGGNRLLMTLDLSD